MTKASPERRPHAEPFDADAADTHAAAGARHAEDVLVSVQVMTLAALIRRGAALAYRRELALGYNEWRVISVVGFHGPLSHKELAEHLGLDKGQVSREVTELAARGLLARKRERRVSQVSLTEAGEATFRTLTTRARQRNLHFLRDLSADERKHLFAMLRTVRARALDVLKHEQDAGRP